MKKGLLLVFLGCVLLVMSACGNTTRNADLNGEQQFGKSCASCHGNDLKSGYAADLDKIGTQYTADEIEEVILNGKGRMPGGFLKGEDAKKVAEWLAQQK